MKARLVIAILAGGLLAAQVGAGEQQALKAATVNAEPNDETGTTRQQEKLQSAQSGTSVQPEPKTGALSKRNKAMLEQAEAAKIRRDTVQSGVSGTLPKKSSMSRREKAAKEVAEQARKRQAFIRSENSNTATKTK